MSPAGRVGTLPGPVVDTAAAEEFMHETLARVPEGDLYDIAAACERKSRACTALLGEGRAQACGPEGLRRVLRSVFACRSKADAILEAVGAGRLAGEIEHLLSGADPVGERIERLDALLGAFPGPAFDLPGELLHFTDPGRYWLWTRWMWDPRPGTGALRLVTTGELDLRGTDRGETYLKVGQALAVVGETGEAVGFTAFGSPFGIDLFLACVYAIYTHTVLRIRMTREFGKVVPELPDLVRRLLGVHRLELGPPGEGG